MIETQSVQVYQSEFSSSYHFILLSYWLMDGFIVGNTGELYYHVSLYSYVLVLVIGMTSTASDSRLFTQFGMTRRRFFQSQLLVHGLVAILSVLSLLVMIGLARLFAAPTEYYSYFSNGDETYSPVRVFSYFMYSAWCFFLMALIGAIYALFINRFRSKGRGIILGLTFALPICYMAWIDYAMMPNFYYPIIILLGIFFQPLICLPLGVALVALYWVLIMKHDSQDMFAI